MNDSTLKMIVAGILFGMWPLLMNKSNLNSTTSTVMFAIMVLIFVVPAGVYHGLTFTDSKWWFAILAGGFGALGLLVFNSGLSEVSQKNVSKMFIFMIVVQIVVPALYHVYVNGGLTLRTASGFAAAILTAILLT